MRIKHWISVALACFLALTLTACTTHKKIPNNVGVVDATRMHGGPGGESYTEGMGGDSSSYAESSKCRPGRLAPKAEQHYFFDFDCNDVRQDGMASLQMQANYLIKHPSTKIRLEGNTDDRGSREYNVALGERRARAVLDVLKQYGVSSGQVTIVSFGAEKPAAGGEDESSYQCNRRVDLIYCTE
ncbi:MAG: OmpA family protein [Gammaproteobacteria bacterium]|nr:OmpA family protein [Gammaproteobacteria bacterium]